MQCVESFKNAGCIEITEKKVALIGCGGLGCNAAIHLAGAGIRNLIICDCDTISLSNLNRQFLYTPEDEGRLKVNVMAERLISYTSGKIQIEKHSDKIEKIEDLTFTAGCDAVVCAVDNDETRELVSDYCQKNSIPLVCGGINNGYGMAYVFIPDKSLSVKDAGLLNAGESICQNGAFISCTAGVIGALESSLTLRILNGTADEFAGKLMVYDGEEIKHLNINANKNVEEGL